MIKFRYENYNTKTKKYVQAHKKQICSLSVSEGKNGD